MSVPDYLSLLRNKKQMNLCIDGTAQTVKSPFPDLCSARSVQINRVLPDAAETSKQVSQQPTAIIDNCHTVSLTESWRQKIASMLEADPSKKYAVLVEDITIDPVLLSIGIQGLATFQLEIPLDQYDGIKLLELIPNSANSLFLLER